MGKRKPGKPASRPLRVPGILNLIGPDSLASLRKPAESHQLMRARAQAAKAAAGVCGAPAGEDHDDEVPNPIENFDVEESGEKPAAAALETPAEGATEAPREGATESPAAAPADAPAAAEETTTTKANDVD